MSDLSVVRYAVSTDDAHIAYATVGDSESSLILLPDLGTHIEALWEEPGFRRFAQRLARFRRVALLDLRGSGLSDPLPLDHPVGFEQWTNDVVAVADALGLDRFTLVGVRDVGGPCIALAATRPTRVDALVLVDCWPKFARTEDYPYGFPAQDIIDALEHFTDDRGADDAVDMFFPTRAADPVFRKWYSRYQRLTLSPGSFRAITRFYVDLDVLSLLGSIRVPTLVIHHTHNPQAEIGHGRYVAEAIADSRFIELPGADAWPWLVDADTTSDEVEEFLTGTRGEPDIDRIVTTLLFVDIVSSTKRAAELGDRRWRDLLDRHDAVVREQLVRFRGREVNTTGDGFLISFDGPASAVHCAQSIARAMKGLDIDVHLGIHTGECEVRGDDVAGVAVHIAARVCTHSTAGEVVTTSTVRELVAGSAINFEPKGEHELKGVPGSWRLYAVVE